MCLFSQENKKVNDTKVGFFIGLCADYLHFTKNNIGRDSITNISANINPVFNVGIYSEFKIKKNISFYPQLMIGFYGNDLSFQSSKKIYDTVSLVLVQLPLLIKYNVPNKNINIIGGFDFNYNLASPPKQKLILNKSNVFLEIGIQKIINFKHYNLIPEIRYSYSILNTLNGHNSEINKYLQSSSISIISVIFNFERIYDK